MARMQVGENFFIGNSMQKVNASHNLSPVIAPKQKETSGQTQIWQRVISALVNGGKISKLEGVQILECWQVAGLKHENDQKSVAFAHLLCGKFGTSKGSALHSTVGL